MFALLAFVVVDGSRRTLADDPSQREALPTLLFVALAAVCCASFAVALRGWQVSADSLTPLLLALAWAPVVIALGSAFAGAPVLVLWASLALALTLAGCWAGRVGAADTRG